MKLVLARIDDRFIHGQVTVGWGQKLRPDHIVLVNDEIAADSWQAKVYALAVPPGMGVSILSVAEAAAALARPTGALAAAARVILLAGSPADMRALVAAGVDLPRINLGGLHHASGKRELLPSVYLGREDLADLRELVRHGIEISAQMLPGAQETRVDGGLLSSLGDPS